MLCFNDYFFCKNNAAKIVFFDFIFYLCIEK